MMRSLLLVTAGILPLLAGSAFGQTCSDITDRICPLSADFNPELTGTNYKAPACSGDASYDQVSLIQNGFDMAPAQLKEEICNLKKIFVFAGDYSFGLWENPKGNPPQIPQDSPPGSYVAISSAVIGKTLSEEEDEILQDLGVRPRLQVSHVDAPADASRALAMLAIMAHEIGHIKWHRDNIASSLLCYPTAFVNNSWEPGSVNYGNRWTAFGQETGMRKHGISSPKSANLNPAMLRRIYAGGFASAFAAVSPEEDFVETYKLMILRHSPLERLQLNVPGGMIDVKNNSNDRLNAKVSCVSPLVSR
jgi:hypothetical protein